MGVHIVVHAFRLVFRNLSDALKVSIGPYLIGLVIAALAMMALGGSPAAWLSGNIMAPGDDPMAMAGQSFASLVAMLVMLFISSWVAVSWHRFVLLEEYPGILPALSGRPVWPYIGKAVRLALLLIVIAIPVMIVVMLVVSPLLGDPGADPGAALGPVSVLVAIAIGTLFTWLSIRFGLVLPAVAVGRQMTFRESWAATAALSGAILSAILILVALNVVVSSLLALALRGSVVFGILDLVVNWVSVMIGLSILTTIYGHAIEGRPLA